MNRPLALLLALVATAALPMVAQSRASTAKPVPEVDPANSKPKPQLLQPSWGYPRRDGPGIYGMSEATWAVLRSGDRLYRFISENPTGPELRDYELPDKLGPVSVHGDYLYESRGREITRRKLAGGPASHFFTAERKFRAFHVFDNSTVALVWVFDSAKEGESVALPSASYFSGEQLRQAKVALVETWDAPSRSKLASFPVPDGLMGILDNFQPVRIHDVWSYRAQDALLLMFPGYGMTYSYTLGDPKVKQLETPWTSLDWNWVKDKVVPNVDRYWAFQPFYLKAPRVIPASHGVVRFFYLSEPYSFQALSRGADSAGTQIDGAWHLYPQSPGKGREEGVSVYHLAEWTAGETSIKPVESTGAFRVEQVDSLRAHPETTRRLVGGVWIGDSYEIQPMENFVESLDKALESRREAEKSNKGSDRKEAPDHRPQAPAMPVK